MTDQEIPMEQWVDAILSLPWGKGVNSGWGEVISATLEAKMGLNGGTDVSNVADTWEFVNEHRRICAVTEVPQEMLDALAQEGMTEPDGGVASRLHQAVKARMTEAGVQHPLFIHGKFDFGEGKRSFTGWIVFGAGNLEIMRQELHMSIYDNSRQQGREKRLGSASEATQRLH